MPVEINKSAFAAVDALFGGEEPSEVKPQKTAIDSSQRLGVGAKAAPRHLDPVSSKILQVGRKRQRENESHVEETAFESIVHDENDEDDLGRTAIESTNNKGAVHPPAESLDTTTNKRKKGKKERALKKQSANGKEGDQNDSAHTDNRSAKDTDPSPNTDAEHEGKISNSSTKRKRRKIRSKQKNIYKDQREKKPDHLIVGNKNYQGRPLTAETRAKLNLPVPKTTPNPSLSGTWTGEGAQASASKNEASLVVDKASRPMRDPLKKGSLKKPKFKNLK